MRLLLIGIIKVSPYAEKADFSYALNQYLEFINHLNINQDNNMFKVYGGLIKIHEELGDVDSANKYIKDAKAYLEKIP